MPGLIPSFGQHRYRALHFSGIDRSKPPADNDDFHAPAKKRIPGIAELPASKRNMLQAVSSAGLLTVAAQKRLHPAIRLASGVTGAVLGIKAFKNSQYRQQILQKLSKFQRQTLQNPREAKQTVESLRAQEQAIKEALKEAYAYGVERKELEDRLRAVRDQKAQLEEWAD